MEYRRLGRCGLSVSALTLGNWATHGAQVDDARAIATVHAALDEGITSFDTSDSYASGRAEELLGLALKGQPRHGVEILTKVFWPTGPGPNERGLSRKHIVHAVEHSLRRLGVDYIDLYQAHRFDESVPLEETLRAFDDLVRQGKVLYVGVSEWSATSIRSAVRIADEMGLDRIVANQPQYSLLWRVIEPEIQPTCEELGIGQIVWSPLAQGVLTGKYLPGAPVPAKSRATDAEGAAYISRWMRDEVLRAVHALGEVAAARGVTTAQLALAWVLGRPTVSSAIIGASRPEQVRENVTALNVNLDQAAIDAIESATVGVALFERPTVPM
jgi:aryl-alcohol dehydrogenase-like predicted oxidoreductase